MLHVSFTGHRPNRLPEGWERSLRAGLRVVLKQLLTNADGLTLYSGLAPGSDSAAALATLDIGGQVHAILPFAKDDYVPDFTVPKDRALFNDLLNRVQKVDALPGKPADASAAYAALGAELVARAQTLVAVWDGLPGRGRGGTRDVMDLAQVRAVTVLHVPVNGDSAAVRRL